MIEMKFIVEAALPFVAVFVATPAVIVACNVLKLHDVPGPLKPHAHPVPRLGGIAISTGLLLAVFVTLGTRSDGVVEFAACVAAVATVGMVDDLRNISPYTRLAIQIAVGAFIGAAGWGIALTNSSVINVLLTCAVVVFFINAFNFLDGSDGLAAGTAAAAALAFLLGGMTSPSAFSNAVAWGLLGCSLAFLVFNWPPARVFLGDSGSTVIGLAVSFLALDYLKNLPTYSKPTQHLFPFVVAAVPLTDAVLAVARRILSRRSPLQGDRLHWYDLLSKRGFAPSAAAIAATGATVTSGLVGWIALHYDGAVGVAMIAVYWSLVVSTCVSLGALPLHSEPQTDAVQRSAETQA